MEAVIASFQIKSISVKYYLDCKGTFHTDGALPKREFYQTNSFIMLVNVLDDFLGYIIYNSK